MIIKLCSLRSWRDFARECICFGYEAVNASGEAMEYGILRRRSPAHASRQLRRLKLDKLHEMSEKFSEDLLN